MNFNIPIKDEQGQDLTSIGPHKVYYMIGEDLIRLQHIADDSRWEVHQFGLSAGERTSGYLLFTGGGRQAINFITELFAEYFKSIGTFIGITVQ
jgi:hypothetical protein